jgi:hypothetical protein
VQRFIKFIKNLIGIAAAGDHCVMSTRADDVSGQYVLILCNAIGTPIDSKYIDIEPVYVDMTPTHVVAASRECVYVWHYKGGKFTETEIKKRRNEKVRAEREVKECKLLNVFYGGQLSKSIPLCLSLSLIVCVCVCVCVCVSFSLYPHPCLTRASDLPRRRLAVGWCGQG